MTSSEIKPLIDEMEAVKKLLILQLVKQGVRQKEIAQVLAVSEATLSRMIPKASGAKQKSGGGTYDGSS